MKKLLLLIPLAGLVAACGGGGTKTVTVAPPKPKFHPTTQQRANFGGALCVWSDASAGAVDPLHDCIPEVQRIYGINSPFILKAQQVMTEEMMCINDNGLVACKPDKQTYEGTQP
jgi:hypothetical protein